MNNKQNYLNALKHKPTEWVPVAGTSSASTGYANTWFEKGPIGGGYDGFGVRWVAPDSGNGAAIPAPGEFILTDVTKWEKLQFPNVDDYDWEKVAKDFLANVDRDERVVDFGCGNGQFERLGALMGFEEALIAMYEEPEATADLLTAITDYKIKIVEKVAKYIKPDTFTSFDDTCTQYHPFMSPDTYEKLILPQHKRLNDACWAHGIMPIQHCCGNGELLIEYFIEEGAAAWSNVQAVNDIETLCQKYGDKIAIIGGFDSNGIPGRSTDENILRAEVRRCIDTYGKYPGYVFSGSVMLSAAQGDLVMKIRSFLSEEADKYAKEVAGVL